MVRRILSGCIKAYIKVTDDINTLSFLGRTALVATLRNSEIFGMGFEVPACKALLWSFIALYMVYSDNFVYAIII